MKDKLVSQRLVTFYLCMITLVIIAFALIIVLSNNASADTHWWDGGGTDELWSTDANWNSTAGNDIEPIAGDDLYYWDWDKSCTWDVAVTVGNIAITANYTGTITQGAVDFGYSDFSMAGGVWTGVQTQWQTCSGSIIRTGGTWSNAVAKLHMIGMGKTLSLASGTRLFSSWFSSSTTILVNCGVATSSGDEGTFIVDGTITVNTGVVATWEYAGSYTNTGVIDGAGTFKLSLRNGVGISSFALGVINCPITTQLATGTDNTMILTASAVLGSTISIGSGNANIFTLDLNGKSLDAAGLITASTRGIIKSSVAGARIDAGSIIVQTDGHIYGQNIEGIIYSDPILSVNNPNLYSYTATSNLTVKTWSKDSGNATWISVGASNGTIYGTPPTVIYGHPEYFTLNLKLLDYTNDPFYQNYTIIVTNLIPPPPEITSTPILTVQQTFLYSYTLTANQTGGVWNFTSNATWLSLNLSILSGTDNNNGSYWVEVTYINVNGTGYQNFTINVTGFVYIPPFTLNDATILGLFFYIMCLAISLIGFRYNMTILCIIALLVSLLPIVSMLNTFGAYAYILLLFYLPLALIPIATYRK